MACVLDELGAGSGVARREECSVVNGSGRGAPGQRRMWWPKESLDESRAEQFLHSNNVWKSREKKNGN